MNRIGWMPGIIGQYLGGPPGRRQQHRRDVQNRQSLDKCTDNRCLPCPGIALQDKTHVRTELKYKGSKLPDQLRLSVGRHKRQINGNQPFYIVFDKLSCHFQALKVISSKLRLAFQPNSRFALLASAQICSISPSRRPAIL